jgi:hypothetical protein
MIPIRRLVIEPLSRRFNSKSMQWGMERCLMSISNDDEGSLKNPNTMCRRKPGVDFAGATEPQNSYGRKPEMLA